MCVRYELCDLVYCACLLSTLLLLLRMVVVVQVCMMTKMTAKMVSIMALLANGGSCSGTSSNSHCDDGGAWLRGLQLQRSGLRRGHRLEP